MPLQDLKDSLEETNGNEGDQVQTPHDSPLSGGHTSDRAEGALNLQELSVLCTNLSNRVLALESIKDAQAAEISALKIRIKRLEKKCKPSISHHRAWLKSVQRLSMKKRFRKKESVSKQGRKKSKPESTLDDSTVFDDQDADHGMEYMETEEAMDEGRQSGETKEVKLTDDTKVVEDKGSGDKGGNAEELVSTARPEVSTARPDIDAARQEDSVVEPRTPPTTTSIFDDEDITMAQTLIKMKEEKAKEKGVSIKDVDDSSRPERSILTLKPLPTIDPKDKGKGVLKESPVKKVKRSNLDAAQIAKDAEIARLIHEKELAEMEREIEERQRQDQASVDYIASLYDEVQAKMDASEELVARLQMKEREMYIIEERSKLLAEFFERRKKLLAEERVDVVRNKPPTRTQLRSLMMTYLKHIDFVPIWSERDEKMIDKMNKKATGMDEEEVPEEPESTKVEVKQEGREENIRKRSGRRLKMKATKKSKRQKTDSDLKEEEQLRASLKIVPNEKEEIDYEVLGTRYPIVNWKSAFYHTDRYGVPHDYYRVFRANGSSRYIKTFTEMVSRFDRLDFIKLHIHILALEDGTEIHMLAERRYPLIRETLKRMMKLRLTAESEGEVEANDFCLRILKSFTVIVCYNTIWFCNHHASHAPCYSNEALAIPEQTATGKNGIIWYHQFSEAYSEASRSIPQKEKDLRSFTLPCFINNICFNNALVDLGASVSVIPLSTYLNLGLGELAHTKLTVELADRTVKYPKGIAKNVLVGIGKFTFPKDFIILDMPEGIKVPLILGRLFLSTARAKIDVYKRKITLRVEEERIVFTSVKPASSLIKRVYMLSLRERMELNLEARLMGETLVLNRSLDPFLEDYIELNDLNEPFKLRRNQGNDLMPTIEN
ncbi:ribonuclease H-like domain, gag-pre-integrase domain protein [Tanacetum coccineum]